MFDLLLRRARLVDDTLTDIAIQDGKIAALGEISALPQNPRSAGQQLRQRRLD